MFADRLAEILAFIVFDPFADLFITLCIVVNTAFMALDQHDMDPAMDYALQNGNYVSYIIFLRVHNTHDGSIPLKIYKLWILVHMYM